MPITELQAAKAIVLKSNKALDQSAAGSTSSALKPFCAPDYHWRGMHPFDEIVGVDQVTNRFWDPLKSAMGPLQRRPDIFLAGKNRLDEGATTWVVEMGHWMGLWEKPWLEIPATRKIVFLRYAEFHRVESETIMETACYVDILNLIAQTGVNPLPPATGATILTPGPRTHDGLLFDPQPPQQGLDTSTLIIEMVQDLRANAVQSPKDHMQRFWTPDMCWFGPGGIGASAFYEGYRRGHTEPFEKGLKYVRHTEHICNVGEGMFGGFFGYPSLTVVPTGGFMGMPASTIEADMRIVDLYRREDDRLAENWIFIDLLHFYHMQGLDILGRIRGE